MRCGDVYDIPAEAKHVILGLQWQEFRLDDDIDIDASCTLLTPGGTLVDTVYSRHPQFSCQGVPVIQFYEDPASAPFAPQLRL